MRKKRSRRRAAFTLMEMLLVLALMAVLMAGLSSMTRLFSRNYSADERRVGRAQLARSISQMLSDDLGAAIQDPISAVDDDPTRQYVRHFGLRGDSRSLQIDVVQPSSFAVIADEEENRRVMSGGDKNSATRQVPELKTVFYEFVPINQTQRLPGETGDESTESSDGQDLGSRLVGSLLGDAGSTTTGAFSANSVSDAPFWDGVRPLAQKFGLSRRELDYETPDDDETGDGVGDESENEADASRLAGSLLTTPDSSDSTLHSGNEGATTADDAENSIDPQMTAAQIALDSDDGAAWAPEVLDCRFRYFDGAAWRESWDSLEMNGLPVAIKVELKLAPLDDVDLYRASPLFASLPRVPSLSEIERLKIGEAEDAKAQDAVFSRLAGSGTDSEKGVPVDVFNSYRTLASIAAAIRGVHPRASSSTGQTVFGAGGALGDATASDTESDAESSAANSVLGGGVSATRDSESAAVADAGAYLEQTRALADGGAVYNEEGVCVDFSNDGSYATVEQIAREAGVSEPTFFEIVAYLPTTPFSRAKTIARRRPATVQAGLVAVDGDGNEAGNATASRGANPRATGTTRALVDRRVDERSANARVASDRGVQSRVSRARTGRERASTSRSVETRATRERGGSERVAWSREARSRGVEDLGDELGGWVDEDSGIPIGGEISGALQVELDAEPNATDFVGGELGGFGGATNLGATDPFAIVERTDSDVPFADSAFSDVDATLDAAYVPGLIAAETGAATVQTPVPSAPQSPSRTTRKQTWIRGSRK